MRRAVLGVLLVAAGLGFSQRAQALIMPPASAIEVTVVQTPSGHSVVVTWTASTDAAGNPTLTYNVYKAPTACTSTNPSFANIGSVAAGVLTFTDTAVAVGESLCYRITSVLNGLEGAPSPTAQAVLPPSPPGSVTATPK